MILVCIAAGLLSALVVNYLADVLPATRRISTPLWQTAGGWAAYLRRPRVLVVLMLGALVGASICVYPPMDMHALTLGYILFYFGLVSVIDIEHRMVMHPVSIAGAISLAAVGLTRHSLLDTVLGGVAGFGFMLAIYFAGEMLGRAVASLRGQKWEETALGFGDVNLAGVMGLLAGWPGVVVALFAGMMAAAIFSAGYLLWMLVRSKYSAFTAIPYAPFLCVGVVFVVLLGVYA